VRERALEERSLGTTAHRFGDRHTGADAELARAVRRRLHDAALLAPATDDEQLYLPQLGVALAADFDEEGVKIDVKDARARTALASA
jgi:hypothetical protein